ncbi:MAG: glycosyltransferase family 4 protein [Lachnospiraceae bacterium]|nr:glycosyltransferase family 4 protein [Lachnospiraceae bacterium]
MQKLAVLFHEPEAQQHNLSRPELGNPGVGGTAFCFALILQALTASGKTELTVYSVQDVKLPCDTLIRVDSALDGLRKAAEDGQHTILLRNHQEEAVYALLDRIDLRYVFWMHNRLTYQEIQLFRETPQVKRVVAVGREMYDLYIDDLICDKMDFVINPFIPPSEKYLRGDVKEKRVTYVGSLIPDKNFHILAAFWKEILAQVPEATLHVIGNGRLYDADAQMGPYGYAEQSYEEQFMAGLKDANGNVLPGVVFHGILGTEKYEVFQDTAVGIINPLGTETFGLAAVEMEACGVPVVCRRKNGLCDAVKDKETGLLYPEISELVPTLVRLLKDETLNNNMGKAAAVFARNTFLPDKLCAQWLRVLREADESRPAAYYKPRENLDNNGKKIRMILHEIHRVPFLRWVPSVHDIQKK